ncbi:MAG: cyclic nucleotide-binding domain-containing protein [Acidimicrobiia bacterium]
MSDIGADRSIVEGLRACPLFDGLDDADLDRVAAVAELVELPAGATIVRQHEQPDAAYVLLRGSAAIEADGTPMGDIGPGDCIGELALLDGSPRTATVTAASRVVAARLAATAFTDLLDALPELHRRLTASLARKLRRTTSGWSNLAGDPEVLMAALLDLQDSPDPEVAARARAQAAELVQRAAELVDAPTGPDPLSPLSPAELRVADLVAEGLSNPAIAERLYLSRYTVESHLKHIFGKLGLRSRVELAALVVKLR